METTEGQISISRWTQLSSDHLCELATESEMLGFQFIRRLIDDWNCCSNQFSRPGEALIVAKHGDRIVGICGLNIDPWAGSNAVGRVRHLYVLESFRRRGIGRRLIAEILSLARPHFSSLRLYTDTREAARFYSTIGFSPCSDLPTCTHTLELDAAAVQ
jgi:GNAT superfamily N-acetyltransferase